MDTFNPIILTLLLAIPLVGAILLAVLPDRGKTIPATALAVTLLTFLATLHLPAHFNYAANTVQSAGGAFQFEQNIPWIANPAIRYHLGIDGLSMWLVVLTGLLAPLGILASWRVPAIQSRAKLFYTLFLLQQVAMLGVFLSLDLFLYYAFWELSLVPMTILIATFGRTANRRRAAIKFFVYAFIPSALLLVAMLWLYARTGTFDLPALQHLAAIHAISPNPTALWLAALAFLLAFAVKVPIFPLHGWMVDAIAEGPTAAIMVLVGKLGLYSILRFAFGIFPEQMHRAAPLMIALGAIGVVYGALLALIQKDLKRLAAFATLGALGFIVLGIFSFTTPGLSGGIIQILSESLSGAGLFLLLGFLYERFGTYDMRDYGGLAGKLPWLATFFVITGLSLIGLPLLNSFIGEFLILTGGMQSIFGHHILWTVVATTGVILSAAYMLTATQRVFYGELGLRSENPAPDLSPREHLAMWPLLILFLVLGTASPYWMRSIDPVGHRLAETAPSNTRFDRNVTLSTKGVISTEAKRSGETRSSTTNAPTPKPFVDPSLAAAALKKPAPPSNPGAHY